MKKKEEMNKRFDDRFTKTWSGLPLSEQSFNRLKSFLQSEVDLAVAEREKEIVEMILDVIQETNWIEEPKSAFGRLNVILQSLTKAN